MTTEAHGGGVRLTADTAEEAVKDYLRENPGVIFDDPEFLAEILPKGGFDGRSVVDFQQVVMNRLRGELDTLREASRDIVMTSRENMALLEAVHRAVIDLMVADSAVNVGVVIATRIPYLLEARAVVIAFEGFLPQECAIFGGEAVIALRPGTIGEVFDSGQDALLRPETPASATLFGEEAGAVNSDALIRLPAAHGLPDGLFAAGAEKVGHFGPELGTELLTFLAFAVQAAVARWVPGG